MSEVVGRGVIELEVDSSKLNSSLEKSRREYEQKLQGVRERLKGKINEGASEIKKIADLTTRVFTRASGALFAFGVAAVRQTLKNNSEETYRWKLAVEKVNSTMSEIGKKILNIEIGGKNITEWIGVVDRKLSKISTTTLNDMISKMKTFATVLATIVIPSKLFSFTASLVKLATASTGLKLAFSALSSGGTSAAGTATGSAAGTAAGTAAGSAIGTAGATLSVFFRGPILSFIKAAASNIKSIFVWQALTMSDPLFYGLGASKLAMLKGIVVGVTKILGVILAQVAAAAAAFTGGLFVGKLLNKLMPDSWKGNVNSKIFRSTDDNNASLWDKGLGWIGKKTGWGEKKGLTPKSQKEIEEAALQAKEAKIASLSSEIVEFIKKLNEKIKETSDKLKNELRSLMPSFEMSLAKTPHNIIMMMQVIDAQIRAYQKNIEEVSATIPEITEKRAGIADQKDVSEIIKDIYDSLTKQLEDAQNSIDSDQSKVMELKGQINSLQESGIAIFDIMTSFSDRIQDAITQRAKIVSGNMPEEPVRGFGGITTDLSGTIQQQIFARESEKIQREQEKIRYEKERTDALKDIDRNIAEQYKDQKKWYERQTSIDSYWQKILPQLSQMMGITGMVYE